MALKFYAYNLLMNHLNAWKREARVNRNRQKRSRMYAIFSAWKFYTKEKVLLRKYLSECNMQTGNNNNIDPNMMTTQEMRDNVARFSAVKSNYCESLSSGTPFVGSTDRILTPNAHILNSAATPQTAYGFKSVQSQQSRKQNINLPHKGSGSAVQNNRLQRFY